MTNGTETKVEIKWAYTPVDFFEETILYERDGSSVEIENGNILARMSESYFVAHSGLRDQLASEINIYFLGLNLDQRKPFEIHGGSIIRIYPDGRTDTTLVLQGVQMQMIVGHVDLVVIDNEGRVHDTRRERIEATKNLAQLSVKHSANPTVRKTLNSFYDASKDSVNELVYLYEIWEALKRELGKKADKILNIASPDRKRLEKLACKNLKQGRHRGRYLKLRDATPEELSEARTIAKEMIIKYLQFLETQEAKP